MNSAQAVQTMKAVAKTVRTIGKKAVAKKSAVKAIPSEKYSSKADHARAILEANKNADRKTVLELFQSKVGLTVAGSATYYYNLTKKK